MVRNELEENSMSDYIKREAVINLIDGMQQSFQISKTTQSNIDKRIAEIPPADVVPKSIYEQTKWERDFAEKRADDMSKLIRNKDVVGVVRCKDCKYYHKEWNGSETHYYEDYWCEWVEPDENDFCSLGERAEA